MIASYAPGNDTRNQLVRDCEAARVHQLARSQCLRFFRVAARIGGLLLVGFLPVFATSLAAQDVLSLPSYAPVVDEIGALADSQKQAITAKLRAFEDTYGAQVAVVVVASTKPEPIEDYANRLANTWKLGRKGIGDGVLMIVARDDRQVRVEVSRALEGALPDLAVKRVLAEIVIPPLKNGDLLGAIDVGVDALLYQMASEEKGQVSKPPSKLERFISAHPRQTAWAGGIVGGATFILLMGVALARMGHGIAIIFLCVAAVMAVITGRQYHLNSAEPLLGLTLFFGAFFLWGVVSLILFGRKSSPTVAAGQASSGQDTEPPLRETDMSSPSSAGSDDAKAHRSGGGGDYAGGGATDRW